MAALKLLLDDTFEYDFALIAMHCSLEDYRLAFILNKYAGLHLKCAKDVYYYTKNVSNIQYKIIARTILFIVSTTT